MRNFYNIGNLPVPSSNPVRKQAYDILEEMIVPSCSRPAQY